RNDEVGRVVRGVNAMLDRLQRTMTDLRRFTADAAHALRTPLTVLRSGLEVALAQEREALEYRAAISDALATTGHINRVADRLLTLTRLEASAVPRVVERIDVAEILRELADAFGARALQQGFELRPEVEPQLWLRGDQSDLYRLFYDLIDNAVRYGVVTSQGAAEVSISARREGEQIRIVIADRGPGIQASDLPQVFERFYRGSDRSSADGGSGLGLSIARQIVRAHGGSIDVRNRSEGGCLVEVVLPADAESADD
ncbi:MAG: HAMP domain-containing histidine kinase, partial [Deltaproteobacteria bacterium]|nr:HAMP domain-containing histidine kinase [Deltaproteobacteria bacterium]